MSRRRSSLSTREKMTLWEICPVRDDSITPKINFVQRSLQFAVQRTWFREAWVPQSRTPDLEYPKDQFHPTVCIFCNA